MKKFILQTSLFVLIGISMITLSNVFLPITLFVYRPWEALSFTNMIFSNAPFYPNATLSMKAVGDLCHHSKNAIVKNESWKIDEIGFRNDTFIKEADIILIGDSFFAGNTLNQSNTICSKIMKIDNSLKVYNMAPSSFSNFDKLLKIGKIKKPKKIIFSRVERYDPLKIDIYNNHSIKGNIVNLLSFQNINAYYDKIIKMYPLKWLKARINNSQGFGIQGINDSKMFFLEGINQKNKVNDLVKNVNTIISYKKYCDSLGIEFLFLPMPDKETVYFELVPFPKQPDYLLKLDSLLSKAGVSTINTLKIYNNYRKTNNTLLYHLDDTHWNSVAINLVATEINHKIHTISD